MRHRIGMTVLFVFFHIIAVIFLLTGAMVFLFLSSEDALVSSPSAGETAFRFGCPLFCLAMIVAIEFLIHYFRRRFRA
jgi:hypothetical protein